MSGVLPEIIDAIISEEPILTENDENNITMEMVDEDEDIILEQEVLEVEKRPKLEQSLVFQPPPQVAPVKKKKRVMSEKQLENLKKARERSNELRKERKAQKDKEVDEILAVKKEKYIAKKVEKAVSKEYKAVDKEQVIIQNNNISQDDIQSIVSKSILEYDNKRVIQKAEKKKKKAVEQENSRINNTIRRAQGLPAQLKMGDEGYFNQCFG